MGRSKYKSRRWSNKYDRLDDGTRFNKEKFEAVTRTAMIYDLP